MTTYSLNLETLPRDSITALQRLDASLVGTPAYLGLAYFWHHEYKHVMRSLSPAKRRNVHKAFLAGDLKLDGVSWRHDKIVRRFEKYVD